MGAAGLPTWAPYAWEIPIYTPQKARGYLWVKKSPRIFREHKKYHGYTVVGTPTQLSHLLPIVTTHTQHTQHTKAVTKNSARLESFLSLRYQARGCFLSAWFAVHSPIFTSRTALNMEAAPDKNYKLTRIFGTAQKSFIRRIS